MRDSGERSSLDLVIEAYRQNVDRTLLLSVEERFLQLMALQELAEELRRAGRQAKKKKR